MIAPVTGVVGEPLHLEGCAYDFGHSIAAIEFSLDGGATWTRYEMPCTNDYQNVTWQFDFIPPVAGHHVLHARSVNDDGRASPKTAFVEMCIEER